MSRHPPPDRPAPQPPASPAPPHARPAPAPALPRIVHIASGREWRGGQIQVWLLARALLARPVGPVEQVVVTTRGSELERRLRAAGVAVRAAGWRLGADPRALVAAVAETRRGPAILHAHDAHAALLSACAAPLTGARFVATRRVAFHLRRAWPWRQADAVIAVVEAVRRVLIEDGIAAERIHVVPSGYDLGAARRARPDDPRPRLGLPPDARLAVNVAALEREKDHRTLIEAAALLVPRVPRLRWLIAGAGSLRDEIERQARAAGLGDRVRLLGHVADPRPLVAAADLFVLSSTSEGAGGAVFDALAVGVPVVTTAAGGVPEIVGDAALVVPPGDPAALAEAVARVLPDDGLRRLLAERGRARIERFEFTRTAEEVIAVYRAVAAEGRVL